MYPLRGILACGYGVLLFSAIGLWRFELLLSRLLSVGNRKTARATSKHTIGCLAIDKNPNPLSIQELFIMNANLPHSSVEQPENACKRRSEIVRNTDFRDGYAKAIMNASAIAMNMPLSEAWTEITERISDINVQAMAWRTSMAILKRLPKPETTPDVGSVNPKIEAAIMSNAHHTVQIGTTRNGIASFDGVKDRFAQELLALLSQYPDIFIYGREHEWGIGCGEKLQLKLRELAQTDVETIAALNVAGVRYD
ncbi:hypothetical protein [Acidithiobacillus sp.]|uniref:hypothetical protein n=1 Tax=Acidithiobacillus sp. TaxID=1872118 RepID=UPI002613B2E1|nr:hypothetical protein [Acidithiobacillus sp.]MDD5279533.1 hypothetical protein [Acidithiobacillus sp.]